MGPVFYETLFLDLDDKHHEAKERCDGEFKYYGIDNRGATGILLRLTCRFKCRSKELSDRSICP